jgi:hypothetical protein
MSTPPPPDSQQSIEPPADTDDELNALRIRQIARVHRAAIRARSYCIVGAGGCTVAMVEISRRLIMSIRAHNTSFLELAASVAAVVVLGDLVYQLVGKAKHFGDEANQSALDQPNAAPDFSSLSDGSQFVKNLEQMGDEPVQEEESDERSEDADVQS